MSRKNPYAKPDAQTMRAKAAGYPARSVFKLEEIDRRARLISHGAHVLDLGAAPGSWSLYASQRVGGKGRVLAVDLTPIVQKFPEQVSVVTGDALALETAELSLFAPYDVVLSDMAPSTSGSKGSDQARSTELFLRALEVARALGKPGSSFLGKLFMSGDFQEARAAVAAAYAKVQVFRPEATRSRSSEVFVLGSGKRETPEH